MKLSRRQMLLSTTGMVVGGIWTSFGSRNVWGQDNAGRMGLALTIGVDRVDRQHYNPLPSPLPSCVNDANAMAEIARSQGFRTITLTDAKATRLEVSRHIYFASQRMRPGDIFMISFSGHGPEHAPSTEPDAEPTGRDQGWCLYDWIMIDDELYSLFQLFQPGVRILAFADSCYSGTSTKVMRYAKSLAFAPDKSPRVDRELTKGAADLTLKTLTVEHKRNLSKVMELPPDAPALIDIFYPAKALDREIVRATYQANRSAYDEVFKSVASDRQYNDAMNASGLLISAAQDNQTARAGEPMSAFTRELVNVWRARPSTYRKLHSGILDRLRWHTPNFFVFGVLDPAFHDQSPFKI